jgi:hypothetical protein
VSCREETLQSFTLPNSCRLNDQLGKWISDAGEIRANFKTYQTQGQAYIQKDKQISIHDIQ